MKRKGSVEAESKATKRRKREKKSESDSSKDNKTSGVGDVKTKLDVSSPTALLKSLLSPQSIDNFQDEHWEKKPLHIKRSDSEYYGDIFSFEMLLGILEKQQLSYEVDLNVCRYVEGEKEMMNEEGVAKASKVKKMFEKQNATVQFHQPQRFSV